MKKTLLSYFLMCFLMVSVAFAQNKAITGKVIAASDGLPLPGVSVTVKGATNVGTQTDANGNFKLSVPANAKTLVFRYVGFLEKEVAVSSVVNVKLSEDQKQLSEVVVTGYVPKTKREFSGATSTVSVENSMNQANGSFDQLLQGQAAGLNVKTGSGQPGRSADIVIRGRGSINGSVDPLYILDGVQIAAADFSSINQNDFESITILKDAASTAIYGSRGANGVIVITTKKGKSGDLRFSYDMQVGNSKLPENKLKLMNSQEKLDFEQNIAGNPWGWTTAEFAELRKVNVNWNDFVFRDGLTQSHQLAASGGNDKTTFYSSFGYYDEEGVVIETGLKKYNTRLNIQHKEKNVSIGTNLAGGWSDFVGTLEGDQSVGSPLNTVIWALPYEAPFTSTGAYTNSVQFPFWINPVEDLRENKISNAQLKGNANTYLKYNFPWIEGLTYNLNVGIDYSQIENFNIINNGTQAANQNAAFGTAFRGQGEVSRGFDRRFIFTATNSLTYNTFLDGAKNHKLNTTLASEIVRGKGRSFNYTGYGLLLPFRNEAGLVAGTASNGYIPNVSGGFPTDNALSSFFTTVDYSYKNKYFLSLVGRRDGSSRLSKEGRFINYGSISGSWVISDENFLKSISAISFMKLRAGYGTTGNQEGIGNFPYLQQYSRGTYAGQGSLQVSRLGNNKLTWERKTTANIGLDAEFFTSKITATIDYYSSLTKGLFFNRFVPGTSGGNGTILSNAGELENKGIEVTIGAKILNNKSFKFSVNANYAYNLSNIKSLPDEQDLQLFRDFQALKVGKPLNSFYLVPFVGVDPTNGSSQYRSANGAITNIYNPNDLQVLGTSDAPHNAGLTTNFSYKGVELSIFGVYSFGNFIYNNARVNVENSGYTSSGFARSALNAWTTPGQVTNFPVLSETTESQTTRFLEKGDFFRLRNIQLGYNIPKSIVNKLKIQGVKLFLQGQNLLTVSDFQGWDPEVSSITDSSGGNASVTGAQYPSLKRITFGLNLSF
ncbi:SusC/RagA family TonB-linked outer membrane protein [Pelobium sp.]|nr:SusC/RagA family TonB-linked outer membrane protein [Pelobium sp.]MDA9555252.1 SusC/RagA family TonB-linked outer membrane protein [Pelobium sp.]